MRTLLFLSFFFGFTLTISAQDLILTTEGESLECKITKVDEEFIFFTYEYKGESRESSIPRQMVKKFKTNIPSTNNNPLNPSGYRAQTFPQLICAINSGLSYRTGGLPEGISEDLKNYMEGMKRGYHFGGHLGCLVNEKWGFGLKASRFRSTVSKDNIEIPLANGTLIKGKMKDDITISYIGPSFSSSFYIEPKQSFLFAHFSAGLISYYNNATIHTDHIKLKGSNVGFTVDLGYDFPLSHNFAFGVQLSYVAGYLTQLELETEALKETILLSEESYESLSRLDLSIGLRFK